MGKRKEEKFGHVREELEAAKETLTNDLRAIVRAHHGPGTELINLELKMMHRRVVICQLTLRENQKSDFTWELIGKKSKYADRAFAGMSSLRDSGLGEFDPLHNIRIPQPLGFSSSGGMFFMERVPGHTVRNLLRESGSIGPVDFAAHAAARLHSCQIPSLDLRLSFLPERLSRLEALMEIAPHRSSEIKQILETAGDLQVELSDDDMTLSHSDFHPAQVLVDGNQGFLIDLTRATIADPADDLGNFLAHISEGENLKDVRGIRRRFLEVYLGFAMPGVEARIPTYEALAYLRRAMIAKPNREDKKEQTDYLIDLAVETASAEI